MPVDYICEVHCLSAESNHHSAFEMGFAAPLHESDNARPEYHMSNIGPNLIYIVETNLLRERNEGQSSITSFPQMVHIHSNYNRDLKLIYL